MAEQGHYPEHWEADVVLRDGATAHLRPIVPADIDAVQAFHTAQSQNSIYMRFFTYKSKLSSKELRRFTTVDYRNRVAFVITRAAEIIGIGRYDRLTDPSEAEVAFNIADAHQGRGLGSILLEHLAAAARENGIRRFTAEVLPVNRKMLGVFSEAGYEVQRDFDDGVVALSFKIDPTERSRAVMESREHRAEARSVAELLTPASIAVIGPAGGGTAAGQLCRHIVEGGFAGRVSVVDRQSSVRDDSGHDGAAQDSPGHDGAALGLPRYGSVAEVPGPVHLGMIAVPYEDVPAAVDECAAAGVQGVLVATGGFADDGERGAARQRSLVRRARAHGMRVIGPASLGLINTDPAASLNASLVPRLPLRGGLGLFSQSAALGVVLSAAAERRSVGLSSFLSAGNRADVSGNDAMQYWEDDPATRAVALYLESIGNPRKFSRIARRLARRKPVIVAKSNVMGLQLPPGHQVRTTEAPAGALDAMLRQAGVIRVETTAELMDVAQVVAGQPLPSGPSVSVVSNSRALGKVVADSAESHALTVREVITELDESGPLTVAGVRQRLLQSLRAPEVHAAVVALLPTPELTMDEWTALLGECGAESGKPVIAAFPVNGEAGNGVEALTSAGLPCYASPGAGVAALAAVVRYAQWAQRDQGEFVQPEGIAAEPAAELVATLQQRITGTELITADAAATAALLGHYGLTLLPSVPFTEPDEAVAAADRLGWPVVIKTTDENLRQRLDLGGVRLNITSGESLRRNIEQMRRTLEPYGSFGLEVQAMAPAGQACAVRAIEDPLLGPVISFGLAGDAVNLLDDWAHRIPPLTTVDAADLVRSPRAARKLFGYQGAPAVDIAALEDLVARLAVLKDEHPELALIELNPVLASDTGLSILSAQVRIGNPAQRTDSARRAMRL